MKIEAIVVCKDYSDFLEHTLQENLQHLDEIIVVTSHDDIKTQRLCDRLSIEHIKTSTFTEDGDTFNKGKAINLGLSNLPKKDWLLHLDADILLPHRFRDLLVRHKLDTKNIYGCDRVNVYGYEAWMNLKQNHLVPHFQDNWYIDPGFCHSKNPPFGVKLGARVIHKEHGWVPIGFFQLWHVTADKRYNFKMGSACGSDVFFPVQWPRQNRILLPEVVCYHLDSEPDHLKGLNWKGRKSRPFAPLEKHEHGECECYKHHKEKHHHGPCQCPCHKHHHHHHPHKPYCPK